GLNVAAGSIPFHSGVAGCQLFSDDSDSLVEPQSTLVGREGACRQQQSQPQQQPLSHLRYFHFNPFLSRKASGTGSGRLGLIFEENLRFPSEDIQCCLGVKRKEPGATWSSVPGDCSHLSRQ